MKVLREEWRLITTVCWPNHMPGGLDLTVLRSEIKTGGGHLLFSRTLRLAKRFGDHTKFVKENLQGGYQTWRSPIGIAKGESRHAFAPMKLLERKSNVSYSASEQGEAEKGEAEESSDVAEAESSYYWRTESVGLGLGSRVSGLGSRDVKGSTAGPSLRTSTWPPSTTATKPRPTRPGSSGAPRPCGT